jgi:hypothetical protein
MALNPGKGCLPAIAGRATTPGLARRTGPLAAAGLTGVAALLLQPLAPGITAQSPAMAAWPPLAVKALLAVNPALMVLAAALLGALLAQRVGLHSLIAGTATEPASARTWGHRILLGAALGLGLGAVDTLWQPHLGTAWQQLAATRPLDASVLAGSMLYGGLAEEILMRWGLMSLIAWGWVSLPRPIRLETAMPVAILGAAALFAAAHLPVLAAQIDTTPGVVARTLVVNGVAGLVYGWLFWRHHLESAMAAHAGTHVGIWAWRLLLP